MLVDDNLRCVISDFGQSEMKSEVYRISRTPVPRQLYFAIFFLFSSILTRFVDIRRDAALASTRADVWLESALSYTSNGRLLVRHSLCRDCGDGEATLAVDGRRGSKALCARSVVFLSPYYASYLA